MNLSTTLKLNYLLTALRQPQWIAAILSLGFHGVLLAAGPSFSSLSLDPLEGSSAELNERRVPLIELTPDEQGRLPDFSAPAHSLFPNGNNNDLFSLFPPGGNSLPFDSTPGSSSSPALPIPKLPSNPFPTGIAPYPFPSRSSIAIPSRRSSLPPIPSRSRERRPEISAPSSSTSPANGSENGANPNGDAGNSSTVNGSQNSPAAEPSTDAPAEVAPVPNEAAVTGDRPSELLARVEYSDTQTSTAEVEFAKAAWLETVQEKLGNTIAQAEQPITLEVPYSGRLCLTPEPTEGLLGLVGVPSENDESALTPWTAVLKSTGYPFLNQAAQQALQTIEPGENGEDSALEPNTLYQVVVKIDYDSENCISREALLQSRATEEDTTSPQSE